MKTSQPENEFDAFAENYDEALHQGISVSGENKEYFAEGRLRWLAKCLNEIKGSAVDVMDYGCGNGTATPYLLSVLNAQSVLGVDSSRESLAEAGRRYGAENVQFRSFEEHAPNEEVDLVFCNGVFHHIPPFGRQPAVNYIYRSLRVGGIFAFWENNPWNPGTKIVMSRIPFDRDAITLSSLEARRLLKATGFEILRTDFLFIFPRFLSPMRRLEPFLSRLPLGAQYQVLCAKR